LARRLIIGLAIAAALAAAITTSRAPADGDPASDMLLAQPVFYPFSPAVTAALQRTLNAEAATANRARFPIKVALIDSPADLGAIPSLFAKPQQYASFLDQEISFTGTKQLLLVVMPSGYGVAGLNPATTRAAVALAKPAGRNSDDLARAAIDALPKLAAAAGHPIDSASGAPGIGGDSGGGGATVAGIGALAAGALLAAAAVVWFRHRRAATR
jgi:hypothetical protein